MATQDREFLRQYARGSDDYVRAQPSRQEDESLTQYLRRVGVDDSAGTGAPETEAERNARKEAEIADYERRDPGGKEQRAYEREQARRAKEAKLAAEAEARQREAQNGSLIRKGLYAAGIAPNKAADTVERVQNWIATRPTPGGRGGMLLLLLLFGAFIIPVSQGGYTRAQLIWLTLLGKTELDETGEPDSGGRGEPKPPPAPRGEPKPPGPIDPGTAERLPFTLPLPGGSGGPQLPR